MYNDAALERTGKVTTFLVRTVSNDSAVVGLLIVTSVRTVGAASSMRRDDTFYVKGETKGIHGEL